MSSFKPVIIAVGFSRAKALLRLLEAINRAKYDTSPKLIIALDGGASEEVVSLAKSFSFKHGELEVVTRENNLGLRKHILWCGNQSGVYGSVIVLEDDLVVDPYYYAYACAALEYYQFEPKVAGIALYSPHYNEGANLPFAPSHSNFSVYAMATACSSGQAWSALQWQVFRHWYDDGRRSKVDECIGLPPHAKKWPESSWKKYFSAYIVERDLFFVYPYRSYTTNCSDPGGTHLPAGTALHQVPLADPDRSEDGFSFASLESEGMIRYDPSMEREASFLEDRLGLSGGSLVVDLYGIKPMKEIASKEYCLTTKPTRASVANFAMSFRPIEMNIMLAESGGPIALAKSDGVTLATTNKSADILDYWSGMPLWSRTMLKAQLKVWLKKIIHKLTGFRTS